MKVKLVIGFCVLAISLIIFNEVRYKSLDDGASFVTYDGQCEGEFYCVEVESIEGGSKITIYNQNTVNGLNISISSFTVVSQDVRSNAWDMVMTEEDDQILLTVHARFRGDLFPSTKSIEVSKIFYALFPFEGVLSFQNEREFILYMREFLEEVRSVGEATVEEPFVFYRMDCATGDEPAFYVGDQSYFIRTSLDNTNDDN